MNIGIVGLGFVGLSLTSVLASKGYITIGIDIDKKKCKQIVNGIDRKSKVLYITRRWKIISLLIKILPERILSKFF